MESAPVRKSTRYKEVDVLRGVAILMMVTYHSLFDLWFLGLWQVDVISGFWRGFAYATVTLFLALVGVSLTLSSSVAERKMTRTKYYRKFFERGIFIFGLGMLITGVTWIFVPEGTILFGVLHLIGLSVILSLPFLKRPMLALIAGIVCMIAGILLMQVTGPGWLLWLGIHPAGFQSLDYTPVLPWFGVVLAGIFLGSTLYPGGVRKFQAPDEKINTLAPLGFLGRHSLVIYLVHQPVILLVLKVFTGAGLF
ncbi:MAG: DUF1624 domain-containing protein [Methanoregulaceae archaeon]|nr:DUF1624 domain-containing protein [Methanoregulaceae archaeon]